MARRLGIDRICCDECGLFFEQEMFIGSRHTGQCCPLCRPERRRRATARYRKSHRDALRAAGRAYMAERRTRDPDLVERQRQRSRDMCGSPKRAEIARRSYEKHADKRRAESRARKRIKRVAILEASDGLCYLCGAVVAADSFEVDHIIPRSRGGSDDASNLAVSCRPCNRQKAARLIKEMT